MALKTCRYCDEEIEHMPGIGWVETRVGGHYDICPENPGTDLDLPHSPASTR